MKKRIGIIISAACLIAVIVATTVTFAIWTEHPDLSLQFEMWSADENASLKYQLYVPVDANYNRIEGTLDIATRTYVLNDRNDAVGIVGLALVGFNSGIAVDVLTIPPTVSYTALDDGISYRITYFTDSLDSYTVYRCLADSEFRQYYCMGNQVIRKINISYALNRIDAGYFSNLTELTSFEVVDDGILTNSTPLHIGDYAFSNCRQLTAISMPPGRVYEYDNQATVFMGN